MPRHTSFVWSLFFKSGYYLLTHGDYFLWNINFFHLRKICSNGKKKSPVNFSHPSFWSFPLNFQLVLKPATGYIILYFFSIMSTQLCRKLRPFDIIEAKLKVPLKPLCIIVPWGTWGFRGGFIRPVCAVADSQMLKCWFRCSIFFRRFVTVIEPARNF